MKFPSVQDYMSYRSYFDDFYRLNKKKDSPTSHRFLAQKLSWPISYMNEVIRGRKNLTMARALEFAKFAKMDVTDTERFISLTFLEGDNESVKAYFRKKLQLELNVESYTPSSRKLAGKMPENYHVVPEQIYSDISLIAIQATIEWADGFITPEEIGKFLYTFPELSDSSVMKEKLLLLEKHKCIEINSLRKSGEPYFRALGKFLFYQVLNSQTNYFSQYAENFIRACGQKRKIGWLNSGFVKLHKRNLPEAEKRIRLLVNWLTKVEREENSSDKMNDKDKSLVFQFDANLISVLNPTELGIKSFSKWIADE